MIASIVFRYRLNKPKPGGFQAAAATVANDFFAIVQSKVT
jgi:hypothetical protein